MVREILISMTRKKNKSKYNIDQCALYKCRSKKRLASLLFLSTEELKKTKNFIKYYSFTKEKKDGGDRKITAPNIKLKKVQKRILFLLSSINRPDWLISGEHGKSYIHNGKYHLKSDYLLTMDIRKYYDNCNREYVYKFFINTLCVSSDVAWILTDIVTFERGIPTGTPTSQLISYYSYQEMFDNINLIAQKHGCIYSLYVDDMTFSSKIPFNPKQLMNEVDIELRKYGHKPKYRKAKYYPKNSHKLITGVGISKDHKLLVANTLQKKIFSGAMEIKDHIKKGNFPNGTDKKMQALRGRLQAAQSVNKSIFPEIKRLIENTQKVSKSK